MTDEQERLSAYKNWLTEQAEKDVACHREGLSPLPRSKHERLTIYYNLPKAARARFVTVARKSFAKSSISIAESKHFS